MVGTGRRRKPSIGRKYTQAEKLNYYKSLALQGRGAYMPVAKAPPSRPSYTRAPRALVRGHGAYREEREYKDESGRSIAKRAASSFVGWVWDKLVGNGAYAPMNFGVQSNSFMKEITANGPPSVWTTNNQTYVFRHREYIGDVISDSVASTFNLSSFPIQPGNATTFPWLNKILRNFQQYRVEGMLFEFVSASSDALNSTNTALGSVLMATNYNSGESDWTNKIQMMQTEFCSVAKPSCSILHPIECKPSLTTVENLYVRTGAVPSGQDIRLYDLGKFQIATTGIQGTSVNLGQLWVTYEIVALKPVLNVNDGGFLTDFHSGETGITPTVLFGTDTVLAQGSNAGTTISGQTISFNEALPGDQYLVVYQQAGSANIAGVPAPTLTYTQSNSVSFFQGFSASAAAAPSTGDMTTTLMMFASIVKMNSTLTAIPTMKIVYAAILDSPIHSDVMITKISPTILPQAAALLESLNRGDSDFGVAKIPQIIPVGNMVNNAPLQYDITAVNPNVPVVPMQRLAVSVQQRPQQQAPPVHYQQNQGGVQRRL